MKKSPYNSAYPKAFTLLEVLVATTISMMLIVLLLSASLSVMDGFKRNEGSIIRQGDATFALDQMVLDLETKVLPNVAGGESLRITPEEIAGPGGVTIKSSWLTLISTSVDDDNSDPNTFSGASRAVSYRLAYQNPIDGTATDPIMGIYRSIASAEHTFANAYVDQNNDGIVNLQAEYWADIPSTPAPPPTDPLDVDNFLSGNIVRLQIRFLRADNNLWTSPFDAVRVGRDGSFIIANGNGQPELIPGGFRRAEVTMTVLSPEGAKVLELERLDPDPERHLDMVIQKHGQTYVRQTTF